MDWIIAFPVNREDYFLLDVYTGPGLLYFTEVYQTKTEAIVREKHLKGGKGRNIFGVSSGKDLSAQMVRAQV